MASSPQKSFYFCFTLDTEPDDLWQRGNGGSFSHFEKLHQFHHELSARGARPVYLTTSEVAEDSTARRAMERILSEGNAELGAHFHTWTRHWPFEVPDLGVPPLQAMAHQLGQPLEEKMLEYTCGSLEKALGVRPTSYRGGRWSFSADSIRSLLNCGISVDTTVTPGRTWEDESHPLVSGPDYRASPRSPFYFNRGSLEPRYSGGELLELPVGATYVAPKTSPRLSRLISSASRVLGLPDRPTGWLWLRPTSMSQRQLSACLTGLANDGIPVWISMIHSSEIIRCTKLKTDEAVEAFKQRCFALVEEAVKLGATCATLHEIQRALRGKSDEDHRRHVG